MTIFPTLALSPPRAIIGDWSPVRYLKYQASSGPMAVATMIAAKPSHSATSTRSLRTIFAPRNKLKGEPPPKDPGGVFNEGPSSLHSVQRRPDGQYAIFRDEAWLLECLNVMKMKP